MTEIKYPTENISIIILAAGSSLRLGQPKQLLLYKGKTLLQLMIQAANNSMAQSTMVVLGANAGTIRKSMDFFEVYLTENADWQEGMASSIRHGLNALLERDPTTDAVIILLCDQPFVSADLLNDLISKHQETGKPVVACRYNNIPAVPALFHKKIFPELLQLKGDVGAKAIINKHTNELVQVDFLKGNVDIDSLADYEKISKDESPV